MATARSGLGHLRRVSTIAGALRKAAPGLHLGLLTNAPPSGLETEDLAAYDEITLCERRNMAGALAEGRSELAVFDTIVVPEAERLPQKLALILRETPFDRLENFRLQAGRPWDALLVPNPHDHWKPPLGTIRADRCCCLGWIYRRCEMGSEARDGCVELLVATGGGGSRETVEVLYPVIDTIIARAREIAGAPVRVRQAIGPRARDLGVLWEADEAFDPGGALNRCFALADIVLSTAGYNSVLELAVTDTPALLVPIPRSLDDQTLRARVWGAKLGFGYDPDAPERAAGWLAGQICNPRRRKPVALGPSGERRASEVLLELLE